LPKALFVVMRKRKVNRVDTHIHNLISIKILDETTVNLTSDPK
jgi:hypothetical protein